jgi:hypothetical protein
MDMAQSRSSGSPLEIAVSRIVCKSVQCRVQILEYVIKGYELWSL